MTELVEDNEDSTLTIDELQQRDIPDNVESFHVPAARVVVEGITRVRVLPTRRMINGNMAVTNNGTPVRVVGRSDQRESIAISTYGAGVYVGNAADIGTSGSYLPSGMTRSYTYNGPIWVTCAASEVASTLVSWDILNVEG